MKHQKQGYSECQLATMAMLAGVPLNRVRAIACRAANVTDWYEAVGKEAFIIGFQAVAKRYLPNLDWNNVNIKTSGIVFTAFPGERGELILQTPNTIHAVAYECRADGEVIIYDPAETKPLPYLVYSSRGYKIVSVIPVKISFWRRICNKIR